MDVRQVDSGVPKTREADGRATKLWLRWYEAFRRLGNVKDGWRHSL